MKPPFELAHKMQRLALDAAWRIYPRGMDEHREQLAALLREHGDAVWQLVAQHGRKEQCE